MIDIEKIKELCRQSITKWSGYASERIQQRGLSRGDIIHCIMSGEIIEQYPDYWINPACLVFGYSLNNKIVHVVIGIDDYVRIIAAYYPSEEKFESDMKTRREINVFLL